MLPQPIRYQYTHKDRHGHERTRTYTLRYKNPQEWEEFGRLNPHIDPKYWDSPIISKDKTDYSKGPIVSSRPIYSFGAANRNEPPSSSAYRQKKTDESLTKRKLRTQARKVARENAKLGLAGANSIKQPVYNQPAYQAGQWTGRRLGMIKAAVHSSTIFGVGILTYIIAFLAFFIQTSLLYLGSIFGLASSLPLGISKIIELLLNIFGDGKAQLMYALLGGGWGAAASSVAIGLLALAGIWGIFHLFGFRTLTGKRQLAKKLWFIVAFFGVFLPIWPWPAHWIHVVVNNPE